MVYAALVTSPALLRLVNAGAIKTIKSAMMLMTMSSSRSVKPPLRTRSIACGSREVDGSARLTQPRLQRRQLACWGNMRVEEEPAL